MRDRCWALLGIIICLGPLLGSGTTCTLDQVNEAIGQLQLGDCNKLAKDLTFMSFEYDGTRYDYVTELLKPGEGIDDELRYNDNIGSLACGFGPGVITVDMEPFVQLVVVPADKYVERTRGMERHEPERFPAPMTIDLSDPASVDYISVHCKVNTSMYESGTIGFRPAASDDCDISNPVPTWVSGASGLVHIDELGYVAYGQLGTSMLVWRVELEDVRLPLTLEYERDPNNPPPVEIFIISAGTGRVCSEVTTPITEYTLP